MEEIKNEREMQIDLMKGKSLSLNGLHLKGQGGGNFDDVVIGPHVYGEVNGIIMYSDKDGAKFAVPASTENRKFFQENDFTLVDNISIPNLNNSDVWGDNKKSEDFDKWSKLANLQASNNNRERAEQEEGVEA